MLLIAEIVLTIAAWRRGWRGWALLPPVMAFAAGFLLGLVLGPEISEDGAFILGLLIDIVTIGVLIAMVVKGRKCHIVEQPSLGPQVQPGLDLKTGNRTELKERRTVYPKAS